MEVFVKSEQEKTLPKSVFFMNEQVLSTLHSEGQQLRSTCCQTVIVAMFMSIVPAAREGRRAARVAAEALQQAGLLQPVSQHADRPGEAGPLLLL